MKICENGVIRELTPAEVAEINEKAVYMPTDFSYSSLEPIMKVISKLLDPNSSILEFSSDEKIELQSLYPAWSSGNHVVGEIYTANDQVWECYQAYDNATYPDINPSNAAWYTFNRPLHGKSQMTAREFIHPTGAHDIYHADEYMIFNNKMYRCKSDTSYSPDEYAAAWENIPMYK